MVQESLSCTHDINKENMFTPDALYLAVFKVSVCVT